MRFHPSSAHCGRGITVRSASLRPKERFMLDFILIATAIGFFALSVAYAYGCDRL
jgi:hypothetical protein